MPRVHVPSETNTTKDFHSGMSSSIFRLMLTRRGHKRCPVDKRGQRRRHVDNRRFRDSLSYIVVVTVFDLPPGQLNTSLIHHKVGYAAFDTTVTRFATDEQPAVGRQEGGIRRYLHWREVVDLYHRRSSPSRRSDVVKDTVVHSFLKDNFRIRKWSIRLSSDILKYYSARHLIKRTNILSVLTLIYSIFVR